MKAATIGIALAVGCGQAAFGAEGGAVRPPAAFEPLVAKHATANGVPASLVHRIIMRESRYNPKARHRNYYGMMQIMPATARTMGFKGDASGLLDADTNLTYGVRYLAGAWKVSGGNPDRAVGLYASGYYYHAKRKGLLHEVGLAKGSTKFAGESATTALAQASAPTSAPAPALVPVPPARDPVEIAKAPEPQPRGFLFARSAPQPDASKAAPTVAAAAGPSVPLPPSRPAATDAATAVAATSVPMPLKRDAGAPVTEVAATRRPAAPAAPVLAAAAPAPVPVARDSRPHSAPAVAAAAKKPRVIQPDAAPVLAGAGPIAPQRGEPAPLAYTGAPRSWGDAPLARDVSTTGGLGVRGSTR